MADPLLVPTVAMLAGGAAAARTYLKTRLEGTEDRYMALYGKDEWSASNMDLAFHFAPTLDARMKAVFLTRLQQRLRDPDAREETALFREEADFSGETLSFHERDDLEVDDLLRPRHGLWIDLARRGTVRVIWNHMQTDGVGMWNAMRPLWDPNPPLIPFRDVPTPPPFLPEVLSLPRTARRLRWRGKLRRQMHEDARELAMGYHRWDARRVHALKNELNLPFNLVSSALVIEAVFDRHPDRDKLTVGLTAYYPFLEGRNRYGVFLCKVRRGAAEAIARQLGRQTKNPLLNWGTSSTQAWALNRLPDGAFSRAVSYYRKQLDVLISSLPVGQLPPTLGGMDTVITGFPWELTLPYYFLLVGTRDEMTVSFTSRFDQEPGFLDPVHLGLPPV